MSKFSIKAGLLVAILVTAFVVPVVMLVRHTQLWGPAEVTANTLVDLRMEMDECTLQQLEEKIQLPQFEFLRESRDAEIARLPGELAWFSPNEKYSVGLDKQGTILWIVDGQRGSER